MCGCLSICGPAIDWRSLQGVILPLARKQLGSASEDPCDPEQEDVGVDREWMEYHEYNEKKKTSSRC